MLISWNPQAILTSKMVVFALCLVLFLAFQVDGCPTNCVCSDTVNECYLQNCKSDISSDRPLLILHGRLCSHHREILEHLGDGTEVILKDDFCSNILNCRLVHVSLQHCLHWNRI